MKKILLTAAALLSVCAVLFTSCAKKGGVKGEDEISGSESAPISEMSEKCSEYSDKLKELKLDNIKISDNISVEIPQKILTGDLIVSDNFDDKYEQIFSHYVNDYDEKLITINENSYPTGPDYDDTDKNLRMSVGCIGFFCYQRNFDISRYVYEEGLNVTEPIKSYSCNDIENCNEKYKLIDSDKEMSVAEAAQKVQDFADDFVEVSNYPNGLKIYRAAVTQTDKGSYFELDFKMTGNDVGVLQYVMDGNTCEHLYNDSPISVSIAAYICDGEVNFFAPQFCCENYNVGEEVQNAPDPVYAVQYMSRSLAEKLELELKRVELECVLFRTGNVKDDPMSDDVPWSSVIDNDTIKPVPCYVFYFDDTPNKEKFAVLWLEDMTVDYVDNSR